MITLNTFELNLLKLSYENYLKTGELVFKFQPTNAEELFNYTNAAESLSENNFINPISENITSNSVDMFNTLIVFELTNYAITHLANNQI